MGPYAGVSASPNQLHIGVLPDVDPDEISEIELPPSAYLQMSSRMSLGQNGAFAFEKRMTNHVSPPQFMSGLQENSSRITRRYSVDEFYFDLYDRNFCPSSYGTVRFLEDTAEWESDAASVEEPDVDYGRWKPMEMKDKVSHHSPHRATS